MSVGSAAAEPYVPTPASTVRSTGKENETSWANSRPNHWLSDHRNPMYGQVMLTCTPGLSVPCMHDFDQAFASELCKQDLQPHCFQKEDLYCHLIAHRKGCLMPVLMMGEVNISVQVAVNSPFKSGADYWRESSEPSRLSSDGAEGPRAPGLAPVGRLFDFKAGAHEGAENADSALPTMPEWLFRRPHLTGEDTLKVTPLSKRQSVSVAERVTIHLTRRRAIC